MANSTIVKETVRQYPSSYDRYCLV